MLGKAKALVVTALAAIPLAGLFAVGGWMAGLWPTVVAALVAIRRVAGTFVKGQRRIKRKGALPKGRLGRLAEETRKKMRWGRRPKVVLVEQGPPKLRHRSLANAYAVDDRVKGATVTVTRYTLEALDDDQMRAVLAHEYAHIRHWDSYTQAVLETVARAVTVVTLMALARWALATFTDLPYVTTPPVHVAFVVAFLIVGPYLSYAVTRYTSRVRERAADKAAAQAVGGEHLADALEAMWRVEVGVRGVGKAYQGVPLSQLRPGGRRYKPGVRGVPARLAALLDTHPPTPRRTAALRGSAERKERLAANW